MNRRLQERFILILLPFALILGCGSLLIASPLLENAQFWIDKVQNPGLPLLSPEEIRIMNEENLKKQELSLARMRDLKEEWTREEIFSLLKEDWEEFGDSGENSLRKNFNQESLRERNRMVFAMIIKRTDVRVFPTTEPSMNPKVHPEFDQFQHSSITPGTPIGIYHFGKDGSWAYAQSGFIRGWIRTDAIAFATEKRDVVDYEEAKDRLVITGDGVTIFGDPSLRQPIYVAQMGNSYPWSGKRDRVNTLRIPFRETDGRLSFRTGYLRGDADVRLGFLPFTQESLARQAFKMLHQPYSWGEKIEGRDCSRFIVDLFGTFGILMPRNSKQQAQIGTSLGEVKGKTEKEKESILYHSVPLATTLRIPGHIMLYLGKDHGKYYVIHSLWGIQVPRPSDPKLEKIGKVIVSDLTLGKSGPHGSLLQRLTEIRFVGKGKKQHP
jgi:hypothetical protein